MADLLRLTPDTLEFVLLSFEGPDQYAMAGGLGVRMKELALELARQGFQTHLVFIGDPDLPALESPAENLTLHRWGQWLSAHYRGRRLPGRRGQARRLERATPRLCRLPVGASPRSRPAASPRCWPRSGTPPTPPASCPTACGPKGVRDKAVLLWNANNVMGFDRIDWRRLDFCSQITTVSRYMKHVMWDRAVNPLVIPNGIPGDRVQRADPESGGQTESRASPGRELVFKIGRFSPDKRWNMAMDALAEEKRAGHDVATVIRGGVEPHGAEVLASAHARGLEIVDVRPAARPAARPSRRSPRPRGPTSTTSPAS